MALMRVALAMAVVLGHLPLASYKFIHAGTAVQGFISGFYMALVLDALWVAIGASLALAAALLVLIDYPVDRWRQRRAERAGRSVLSRAVEPSPAA